MKAIAVSFLVIAGFGVHLVAQQTAEELPTYTTEQRWERASRSMVVANVSGIAYAKSRGQSAAEYGEFQVKMFAPGWGEPGSGSVDVIRGLRANLLGWSGAEFEITKSSDESVTGRVNRPWAKYFGEDKTFYGVRLDEYEEGFQVFLNGVAEHLGLQYEGRVDGDWFYVTFSQKK